MTFLNVVEIESALSGLATAYPSVAQLITLPNTTAEGRTSHALVIGTGQGCPQAGVLIISGAHAREWGGPDICINFAADLLEAYTGNTGLAYGGTSYTAAEIRSIVERVDVIVFPDINPDGRNYSQNTYSMWRKNRNPASSGGQASKIGVDVNRNYDFLWDFNTTFDPGAQAGGTLASTDPSNDLFHGTAPFSEAETKNVRWLFDQYPHIGWFMDIHSYVGDILHAWGDDTNQTNDPDKNFTNAAWNGKRGLPNDVYGEYIGSCDLACASSAGTAVSTAIAGVRGESYAVAQAFFLPSWGSTYPTSGASDDWANSRYYADASQTKVRGYCMEFNRVKTFFPAWADMELIILDVDAGLVRLCLRAVPAVSMPSWWCHLSHWWSEAIWHRVFPPELWGPYGPWERVRRLVESILIPIVRPFIRSFRERR
ncbi:MAG TPA: M14 family metallopeptidase [Pyrinomonadaceae bacterium]|jgi:murein tripeptide amidase MpaA